MTDRHAAFVRDHTIWRSPPLVPEIALHLAGDVTPLWQATEAVLATEGLPPPFWAFAWPGGQALARLLLDRPELVSGQPVLDFAAGSGIAAIAAARAGAARVWASEIDPFAAAAIRLNAARNRAAIHILEGDILEDDVPTRPAREWKIILAGDVCYERPMAERVFAWLSAAAAAGTKVLLADPGRAYLPASGLTAVATYDVPTSLDIESRTRMTTTIYRLSGGHLSGRPQACYTAADQAG